MNAIICLCHFCEAHGPSVLFSTKISSKTEVFDSAHDSNVCKACTSIGHHAVITSKSPEGITYCSQQRQGNSDVNKTLKQAAFRSLSCEVSPSEEGGFFYFGDSIRGHVMSYTFQMKDSLARGLKRWFSIIILMKDKMFLLNLMTYLFEHIEVVAKELKRNAENNFEKDQKVCSQRALRLQTGKTENSKPRSLVELTDNVNVYNYLHQSFTFILEIGRQTYSETLYTSFDNVETIRQPCRASESVSDVSLRRLRDLLGSDIFPKLLYCMLTGIQVIVRAEETKGLEVSSCLSKLMPVAAFKIARCNGNFVDKLICCNRNIISYQPSANVCTIDILNDSATLQWKAELPPKPPTLMKHILNAVEESRLNETVLLQHIHTLKEEWLGMTSTIKSVMKSAEGLQNVQKLKQVLGIKPEDEAVLNYWLEKDN